MWVGWPGCTGGLRSHGQNGLLGRAAGKDGPRELAEGWERPVYKKVFCFCSNGFLIVFGFEHGSNLIEVG